MPPIIETSPPPATASRSHPPRKRRGVKILSFPSFFHSRPFLPFPSLLSILAPYHSRPSYHSRLPFHSRESGNLFPRQREIPRSGSAMSPAAMRGGRCRPARFPLSREWKEGREWKRGDGRKGMRVRTQKLTYSPFPRKRESPCPLGQGEQRSHCTAFDCCRSRKQHKKNFALFWKKGGI